MKETILTKKAYLRHEVQKIVDAARYEELRSYHLIYDATGARAKERLAELKKRLS